ncbi:MAG: DUF1997 domain-containing protein [Chloroherpetonaceae bacterium]
MMIIGKAHGQVLLSSDLETVFRYFSDHKKILGFNPLCKGVVETDLPDVYRWDFEITDPRAHPIQLIFYVKQSFQEQTESVRAKPTDDLLLQGDFMRNIFWSEIPIELDGAPPNDHTFVGLASGQMSLKKVSEQSTFVDVVMRVAVDFQVPILLRVFPEPIIKIMAEVAMSAGMQTVSNKMLESISKDFKFSVVHANHEGIAKLN